MRAEDSRRRIVGQARVEIDAPAHWEAVPGPVPPDGGPDLILEGPADGGAPPRVSVSIRPAAAPLEDLRRDVARELVDGDPNAIVASCDVWPHPVWGDGVLVQSARLGATATWAHDRYLFTDGPDLVQVDVECVLDDLLALEDDVADIVAHTRPRVAAAVS